MLSIEIQTNLKNIKKDLGTVAKLFLGIGTSAKKGFPVAQKEIKKTDAKIVNLTKDGNRASNSMKGLAGSFNLLGFAMRTLSIGAILNFFAEAGSAAINAIETQNLFAVSLGSSAKEANAFAEKLSGAIGMNIVTLQEAMGTYALLAKSMGVTADEAQKLAQNTTMLAIDLASLTNVPVEQVLADLRSGLVGQSETVYKYGMDLTEAGLQEEMFALGLEGTARNLTQGSKMMLRHSQMIRVLTTEMDGGNTVLGDFNRTIMQPANQIKILQEKIKSLSIAIGNALLPVLAKVLPYLIAFVEILIDVANAMAKLFGYNAEEFGTAFGDAPTLDPIVDSADEATGAVGGTSDAIKKLKKSLLGIDELNIMSAPKDASTGGGGGGGGGFADRDITDMIKLPDLSEFYDNITQSSKALKDKMIPYLKKAAIILGVLIGLATILKGVMTFAALVNTISSLNTNLVPLGLSVGKLAMAFGGIVLVVGGIVALFFGFKSIITETDLSLGSLITTIAGIVAVGLGLMLLTKSWIVGLVAIAIGIKALIVILVIKYREEIFGFITGVFSWIWEKVSSFGSWLLEKVQGIVQFFSDKISEAFNVLKEFFSRSPEDIAYSLGQVIGNVINFGANLLAEGLLAANNFRLKVKEKFEELKTNIVTTLTSIKDSIVTTVTNLPDNIRTGLENFKNTFRNTVNDIKDTAKEKFKEFGDNTVAFFRDLPNDVATHLTRLKEKITNIPKELSSWFSTHINELLNIGAQIFNGIIQGLGNIKDKMKSVGQSFVKGLQEALGIASPSKEMRDEVGIWMGLGVADGLQDATGAIVNTTMGIADEIQGCFDDVTGVDAESLVPTNLGNFNIGNAVMTQSIQSAQMSSTPSVGLIGEQFQQFANIISEQNNNNTNDEQSINLYLDGVYQGTVKNIERKNTRAGKTVFSIGGN